MSKISLLASLIASVAIVSCNSNILTNDDNALQLMMGAPSKEIRSAIGTPMKQTGSLSNGTMNWHKDYTVTEVNTSLSNYDNDTNSYYDIFENVNYNYELEIKTTKDKIVSISYSGNLPIVQDKWFYDNLAMMTLNHACASNDLQLLQSTLQKQPSLRSAEIMAQAAAQAARYQSKEVLDYLIQTHNVDIHAPLQTWVDKNNRYQISLLLTNTTIADIIKSAQ